MSITSNSSWVAAPPLPAPTSKDTNSSLVAHLSNLSVDEYATSNSRASQHNLPQYASVHTPPRPAPFTPSPYDGTAQFLYYASGAALDPASFAAAAAAAAAGNHPHPHQYPYDLSTPMQALASAAANGMYDPYHLPLDNYSPNGSVSSNGATSNLQPQTPGPYQPPTGMSGASNAMRSSSPQVYRPPHLQQQLQQHPQSPLQQANFFAYGDRAAYWSPQQHQLPGGRENGPSGGRHRHPNSAHSSNGRTRAGSQLQQQQQAHYTPADFSPYGLPTPLTPAFTGPGGQFSIPTTFVPPYSPSPAAHYSHKGNRRPVFSGVETTVVRSQRLEDFRQRKASRLEFSVYEQPATQLTLQDIYGNICEFAGDQHGSRFIQNKLETSTPEERAKVFEEIMPNAFQLMTDVFGNYVIQKMFQFGDEQQMGALAKMMEGRVLQLSMQMYGCRVMQKALEHLQLDLREPLVDELDGHIIECVKSSNANHVIQRLISLDPPQKITDAFTGHVQELSSHPFGCRVLQKTFEVLDPAKVRTLLDEMHQCSLPLMFDQFGNYVVQSVISSEPGREHDRDKVIKQMRSRIFELSRHKFASNVVERAIRYARPSDRRDIIREMLDDSNEKESRVSILLRDSYGNFTVQTALNEADADQRDLLLETILPLMPNLRHTPCGRRLEAKIGEFERDGIVGPNGVRRGGSSSSSVASTSSAASSDGDETAAESCLSVLSASPELKVHDLRRVATSPDAVDEATVYKALLV